MDASALDQWGRALLADPKPEKRIPLNKNRREEYARNFLELAELWACTLSPVEKEEHRSKFESYLWPYCLQNAGKQDIGRWPYLIASVIQVAASIDCVIDPGELNSPSILKHCRYFEKRPQIFTLVTHDIPYRVHGYFTRKHYGNDQEELCGSLIEDYFEKDFSWRIENLDKTEGHSWMLSVVISAIVRHFSSYPWPERIGCTGIVEENGQVGKIEALEEKLETFFALYPDGVAIVPAVNISVESSRDKFSASRISQIQEAHKGKLWVIASIEELLCHCRQEITNHLLTTFWKNHTITMRDWRGESLSESDLLTLEIDVEQDNARGDVFKLLRAHSGRTSHNTDPYSEIFQIDREKYHGTVIKGEAGYGKSVLLGQCYQHLLEGSFCHLGLPVLLKTREWAFSNDQLEIFIARQINPQWTWADLTKELGRYNLQDRIWLLIDGFDEIGEGKRAEIERFLFTRKFPYVLTTRGLASDPHPPAPKVVRLQSLSKNNAVKILQFYNREDLLELVSDSPDKVFDDERLESWTFSPLSVSILAATLKFPVEELNLRNWVREICHYWIRRAEKEKRLSPNQVLQYEQKGSLILGRAALQMLKSERLYLEKEDLRIGLTEFPILDSEIFQRTVEQTGFLIPVGPGAWEFAHKQIAEYLLADYLHHSSESDDERLPCVLDRHSSWVFTSLSGDVLIFLSQLFHNPEGVLAWLEKQLETYYFEVLYISTRILAASPANKVEAQTVVKWMRKRIVLASYFPQECSVISTSLSPTYDLLHGRKNLLPISPLDYYTDIVCRKWQSILNGAFSKILELCAPALQECFVLPPPANKGTHLNNKLSSEKMEKNVLTNEQMEFLMTQTPNECNSLAAYLIKVLNLCDRVTAFMICGDRYNFLAELGRGKWANVYRNYLDDPDLGNRAKEYFFQNALPEDILPYLSRIDSENRLALDDSNVAQIFSIVAEDGTSLQQKEALVRSVAYYNRNRENIYSNRYSGSTKRHKTLKIDGPIDIAKMHQFWPLIWGEGGLQHRESIRSLLVKQAYSTDPCVDKKMVFTALKEHLKRDHANCKEYLHLISDGLRSHEISTICWKICSLFPVLPLEKLLSFLHEENCEKSWQVAYSQSYAVPDETLEHGLASDVPQIRGYALACSVRQGKDVKLESMLEILAGVGGTRHEFKRF